MKNILYLIMIITTLFSCESQKKLKQKTTSILTERELTSIESNIVNDFLDDELKKEQYKNYLNHGITIIRESFAKTKPIDDYIFSYKQWFPLIEKGRFKDVENAYIIDTLKLKKLKYLIKMDKPHMWKSSDIKNLKVNILKNDDLVKIINTGEYITLPKQKIIYLSTPMILDESNAFLSFNIGNGELGFSNITHFTVLMKKVNNKWIQTTFYEDGVFY